MTASNGQYFCHFRPFDALFDPVAHFLLKFSSDAISFLSKFYSTGRVNGVGDEVRRDIQRQRFTCDPTRRISRIRIIKSTLDAETVRNYKSQIESLTLTRKRESERESIVRALLERRSRKVISYAWSTEDLQILVRNTIKIRFGLIFIEMLYFCKAFRKKAPHFLPSSRPPSLWKNSISHTKQLSNLANEFFFLNRRRAEKFSRLKKKREQNPSDLKQILHVPLMSNISSSVVIFVVIKRQLDASHALTIKAMNGHVMFFCLFFFCLSSRISYTLLSFYLLLYP